MLLREYISNFIKNFGGDTVFGIIGTPNVPLFDYLDKNLKVVQNTHENNCVYSAIGGYLFTGKIHFVIVTSGVGVTNLITALTDAYLTDIPVFVISTNSNTKYYGLGNHHDSSSINDGIDTVSLTKSCTCFSALGSHPNSISKMFIKAYNFALENKKPVHISISKNLFEEDIKFIDFPNYLYSSSITSYNFSLELITILKKSTFPVIVTSNLVDNSIFSKFINNSNIIFLNTLSNVSLNNNSEYFIGNYEYVKNDTYNKILDKLDLVIFLGNKLDKYFIDFDYKKLSSKTIIHISENNLDKSVLFGSNYFFINGNIDSFVSFLDNNLDKKYYSFDFISKYKSAISLSYDKDYNDNLFYHFLKYFNLFAPSGSSVFIDVGSVLNYCSLFLSPINKVYVNFSSSFFNMGNSYKSIGYSFYNKNNNFIFIGDGSFYMSLGEILTAIENNLNLTFVILNNNGYSSPLYMKYGNDIGKDKFCKYSNGIDLFEFSKSLNIKYFLLTNKTELSNLVIDGNLGVNILEIKGNFNDKMPL